MLPSEWLVAARARLAPYITRTPVFFDGEHQMLLKWESYQLTGSFKVRGALNKILTLAGWETTRGLVTASAGNHGQGVAYAGQLLNLPVTVFAPDYTSQFKLDRIQQYGAQVQLFPGGFGNTERAAKLHAAATGKAWISAYNDGQIIAGHATIVDEILSDNPAAGEATWIVPIGGGGLISGVISALLDAGYKPKVVGVQPAFSPYFYNIFKSGTQVGTREFPTLAEGLAGEIEENSLTIPIVRRYVEDIILVTEEELVNAMAYAWNVYGEPIEPSAAASLSTALTGKLSSRPAVVIISGGNIQPDWHKELIYSATQKDNEL